MISSDSSPESIAERRRRARRIAQGTVLIVILLAFWMWCRHAPISGRGGFPVPGKILIGVGQFHQGDLRWNREKLADTQGSIGAEGCAVTSAAMVLSHYGMEVDPLRLNRFLREHGGYEGRGWIRWESAAEFLPGRIKKAYEDVPSLFLIDWNLLRGNPAIIRIRRPDGITHFVVIVGKQGFDYLIRDPAGAAVGRIYPFRDLGVPGEALRYYRRID